MEVLAMRRMIPVWMAVLMVLAAPARAQQASGAGEGPVEAGEPAQVADEEEAAAPAEESHAPQRRAAKPKPPPIKKDDLKLRLAEIAKVYKSQMVFAGSEVESWKAFWTKMRDERGLFEMRLSKQRDGFVESLRSLDPRDHSQSLTDFETMQNNVMRSFEENQSSRIREFILERETRVREFGAAQESERARLAQSSSDAWEDDKSRLNLQALPPPEKPAKKKSRPKSSDKGD